MIDIIQTGGQNSYIWKLKFYHIRCAFGFWKDYVFISKVLL